MRLADILGAVGAGREAGGFARFRMSRCRRSVRWAFRVQRYGMLQWGDLFTARQKVALVELTSQMRTWREGNVRETMAMLPSKLSDRSDSCVAWSPLVECPTHYLTGNALPMGWDFVESNILSDSSGSIGKTLENISHNVEATVIDGVQTGVLQQADATAHPLP